MAFFKKKQQEILTENLDNSIINTQNTEAIKTIENITVSDPGKYPQKERFKKSYKEKSKSPENGSHEKLTNNHKFVKLIPLGGLGEIGRNMMAIEMDQEIIIIDAGVMFPDASYPGIDLLLPDFTYLKTHRKKIKALMITHGHEDHIGGIPFLLKEISDIPIYAPKMAMELIKGKLHEHKIQYDRKKMHYTEKRKIFNISRSFSIEYMEVNHSIPDSYGLAIHTPIGTIVHTGDFKIEVDSLGNSEFDFHKFAEIGQKGVLLLCADSTNVEKKIEEKNESDITKNIAAMIENAEGRVIIATFASNVNRVANIVSISEKLGKKVCLLGRNMENNFEIAQKLGYIQASKSTIVTYQNIKNYPDNKVVIISTGTQGETLSALTRISQGLHKTIKVKNTDTIIISASVIPGNEKPVSKVLDQLAEKTRKVYYSRNAAVHVSGHATQNDLLTMLRLVKPKFFMPVHGEKRFLLQHTYLAHSVGVPESNTIVCKNGDIIQLTPSSIKSTQHIKHKNMLVENGQIGDYKSVIEERVNLSKSGFLFITLCIDTHNQQNSLQIHCSSKGFLLPEKEGECFSLLKKHLEQQILEDDFSNQTIGNLTTKYRKSIEFLLNSKYNRLPIIEVKILGNIWN